ncbi:hypothetical protein AVEN_73535-1 [Araneus ventricosus]|uniref:Uncharacterized protein n=1 Tax=Araneus ventricosus TaxID=182803 RepID=A0A4Y2JGX4_ARAVE|nr:hypothetical protein AVEN_73535-1 [Araneus ventricosus]
MDHFTCPRHDHTDEQHRPCVAWQFKTVQKRAVNNAQKGYIVEEGDFPERPVTRSESESGVRSNIFSAATEVEVQDVTKKWLKHSKERDGGRNLGAYSM